MIFNLRLKKTKPKQQKHHQDQTKPKTKHMRIMHTSVMQVVYRQTEGIRVRKAVSLARFEGASSVLTPRERHLSCSKVTRPCWCTQPLSCACTAPRCSEEQVQGNTVTNLSSFAVLSHSMSNCHRSRTSLFSMLEMTTTRRCTLHLYSHSERCHSGYSQRQETRHGTEDTAASRRSEETRSAPHTHLSSAPPRC